MSDGIYEAPDKKCTPASEEAAPTEAEESMEVSSSVPAELIVQGANKYQLYRHFMP